MTETPTLSAALVSAMADLENVPKSNIAKVGSYSYSYADLGDTLTAVRPVLARHGLGVTQEVSCDGSTITVVTVIWHASGETYRTPGLTLRAGVTAQETGSAITYARRYSLLPALGLATEDDDGAQASQAKPNDERTRQQIADESRAKATVDHVLMLKGTPRAAALKKFVAANRKRVSFTALRDDPDWRATVDEWISEHPAAHTE